MQLPARLKLANLPTPVGPLERLTKDLGGPEIWIKRDDQTGTELSGNKIRKLEYALRQALDQGCDTLITCGGIQSNHARATAAAAARLGLECILVLNSEPHPAMQGNYLMDQFFGAKVILIAPEETKNRQTIMEEAAAEAAGRGKKAYLVPLGASNGIGSMGYVNAMAEIMEQEEQLGFRFDAIVCAMGSGGTYGGLVLGQHLLGHPGKVYGVPITDNAEYFRPIVGDIIGEAAGILGLEQPDGEQGLCFLDGYAGRGYALSQPQEIETIRYVARTEGLLLDPVYTGKAMHGLISEIRKRTFTKGQRVLFIHTGGLFGVFHFLAGENMPFGGVK